MSESSKSRLIALLFAISVVVTHHSDARAAPPWPSNVNLDKGFAALTPFEKGAFVGIRIPDQFSPENDQRWTRNSFMAEARILDMSLTGVSMSERVAFVGDCVRFVEGSHLHHLWNVCASDAEALDRELFSAELDGLSPAARQLALKMFDETVAAAARWSSKPEREVDLGGSGASGRQKWRAAMDAGPGMVALAEKIYLLPPTPGETTVVADTAWASLAEWAHEVKAQEVSDPTLAVVMAGLRLHLGLAPRSRPTAKYERLRLIPKGGVFGERTAAIQAQLAFTADFEMVYYDTSDLLSPPFPKSDGDWAFAEDTIAKIKRDGEQVIVTFKRWRERDRECVELSDSKKVRAILPNGQVAYEQVCVRYEMRTGRDDLRPPITVPKRFAAGLAPNRVVAFAVLPGGAGYPIAVYTDAEHNKPLALFGTLL